MSLLAHKIPIITGRNDVPTTGTGQANHPNGSFVTAKYNALVDELSLSSTTKTVNNELGIIYCLDLTASIDGNGTEANPFNSVDTLVKTINANIVTQSNINVYCLSNVDFGHLEINGTFPNNDWNDLRALFISQNTTEIITYDSIKSTIPIIINHSLTQNKPLFIQDSTVTFQGDLTITGSNCTNYNSTLNIEAITVKIPNLNLQDSFLKSVGSTFSETILNANNSKLFFDNLTLQAGDGVDTFYNGLSINPKNSEVTIINSTLANADPFITSFVSNLYFEDVDYSQINAGDPIVVQPRGTLIVTRNCTGLTQDGIPMLRIDDGVII